MGRAPQTSKFETTAEYTKYISTLNKARLQDLCMEQGLFPSHDRKMMIKALEKKFKTAQAKSIRNREIKKIIK